MSARDGQVRARRRHVAALVVAVAAAGCGDDIPTAEDISTSAPAVPTSAPATPVQPAPDVTAAVVVNGIEVQVPAGWKATRLTPAAQAEALAGETDPRVVEFLRDRLRGLAAQGGVLYLYDLRDGTRGELATVEVYRYASERTPEEVVDQLVLPRLQQSGFTPVRGRADLPAGPALTLTTQTRRGGTDLRNEFYVLPLGPSAVGLSATTVGPPSPDVARVVQSLRAA